MAVVVGVSRDEHHLHMAARMSLSVMRRKKNELRGIFIHSIYLP